MPRMRVVVSGLCNTFPQAVSLQIFLPFFPPGVASEEGNTAGPPLVADLPTESPAVAAIRVVLTKAVAATAAAAVAGGGTAGAGEGFDVAAGQAADLAARKAGLRARLARLRQVRGGGGLRS